MNYLDGYVEEVLSEPYYDDYGSGIFRWWVEVSYICEGTESTTILITRMSKMWHSSPASFSAHDGCRWI